jgi:hypothetical protein
MLNLHKSIACPGEWARKVLRSIAAKLGTLLGLRKTKHPLIGMVFSSSFDLESLSGQQLVTSKRRGTQAARGRPAKPFLAGSIPARASILLRILFLLYGILSGGSQILGEETWRRGC